MTRALSPSLNKDIMLLIIIIIIVIAMQGTQ